MRVRSNRPTTVNPGMKLGPWGPGDERDVDDEIGRVLVGTVGFVEVVPVDVAEEPAVEAEATPKAKAKRGRKKKGKS